MRTQFTGSDEIGVMRTIYGGVGFGLGWWSAGITYQLSNAKKLQQLNDWFQYMSASFPFAGRFGLTAIVFWGGPIIGIELGPSVGPAANFVPTGESHTWVNQFQHWWVADPARILWDQFMGGVFSGVMMEFWLNLARFLMQHRRH